MMISTNVSYKDRFCFFHKGFETATDLDGLMVNTLNKKEANRCEYWKGSTPKWVEQMRTWG